MAVTLNDLRDRGVVAVAEGLQLGRPADLLVDVDDHRLAFVVVAAGAVPDTAVVAPASALAPLSGSDTLALHGLAALDLAFRDQLALNLIRRGVGLTDLPVVTDGGEELGTLTDVELDDTGAVVAYLVRRGGVSRILRAHRIAPAEVRSVGQVMTVSRPAG